MTSLEILAQKILAHQLTVATAESCTGGLLAAKFTDIAGSSRWFDRALITYSNQAKQQLLGVTDATLSQYGAVSEACVLEMLAGLLQMPGISLGIAISGIAGPEGGTLEKPVGTVCFAIGQKGLTAEAYTQHFSGNRQQIREQACEFVINYLTALLK